MKEKMKTNISAIWEQFNSEEKAHQITIEKDGTYFKPTELGRWLRSNISLNSLARSNVPIDEVKKLYRDMGYSVLGYWEIFYADKTP